MIKEFTDLLTEMQAIHSKKNEDYANQDNQFESFERSAELMSWFARDTDKAFSSLIGTKLARLATLLNKEIAPNNESIEDSFLDLCTYCALWASYHKRLSRPREAPIVEYTDRGNYPNGHLS